MAARYTSAWVLNCFSVDNHQAPGWRPLIESMGLSPTRPIPRGFWQAEKTRNTQENSSSRTGCCECVQRWTVFNGLTLILSSRPFKTHFLDGWKDRLAGVLCPTSTLPSMGENSKYCTRALGPESSAWKLKLNFPVLIKVNSHWTYSFSST